MAGMKKSTLYTLIAGAVIVLLLVASGTLFWKYRQLKTNPNAANEATSKRVLASLGEHYQLPTGEEPTIAQVQDKSKLDGQEFYKHAQNGDYIIIYSKAKTALLYRESLNKIINVGPVSFNTTKPIVALLNGSGAEDKLKAASTALGGLAEQISLSGTSADAKNKATSKTIVIDVSGKFAVQAKTIADKLGGSVESNLPNGENAPTGADIVVLVGKS